MAGLLIGDRTDEMGMQINIKWSLHNRDSGNRVLMKLWTWGFYSLMHYDDDDAWPVVAVRRIRNSSFPPFTKSEIVTDRWRGRRKNYKWGVSSEIIFYSGLPNGV